MSFLRKAERTDEEFTKIYKKYNDDKYISDEGVFVSELVNGDDDSDDSDYEYIREPQTEFEKCLSKMDGVLRQSEQDTQSLNHDLKVIQSKNESTARRIIKLSRDAAEFRTRLNAFLQSFGRRSSWRETDHVSMTSSPRNHKATYAIFLKQNSIEQPVHVNIAVR